MSRTRLQQLTDLGQSVWYDNISRELIGSGSLEKLRQRGIRGVTSNPTIFEKAIANTNTYDSAIEELGKRGMDARQIFEQVAIEDIRAACDVLRPVFDATKGQDGYVSYEVSPELAFNTKETLADAKRLFARIAKDNVMIKIPGTKEGMPAIRAATAEGININITLLFAIEAHDQVIDAYLSGLEDRVKAGKPIDKIASVASFFVSRVDTKVDKMLEDLLSPAPGSGQKPTAARETITAQGSGQKPTAARETIAALFGQTAIANARMSYRLFLDRFQSPRFAALKSKGARVQRPLWASTSTKNPKYRDVVYCEQLIGPDTVNTMPPATVDAFDDHGVAARTLPDDVSASKKLLADLAKVGIDLKMVCDQLVDEGVKSFAKSFTELLGAVAKKRSQLVSSK
jgi:transaldolase